MKAEEYMKKLDGDATVGITCLAKVKETGQVYTARETVSIDLPDLIIVVSLGQ